MSSLLLPIGGLSRRSVQFFVPVALLVACMIAIGVGAGRAGATHSISTVDKVSIDMDPHSAVLNTATSISTVQPCARINNNNFLDADEDSPDQVLVDVVVGPPGIPIDRPLVASDFELLFDPLFVFVASYDLNQLLMANPGSILFDLTDPVPDSTGSFYVGAVDIGVPISRETGPGVLARLTLEGAAGAPAGQSLLTFWPSGVVFLDDQNERIPVNTLQTASVSVDQPCLPPDADGDGIANANDACPNLAGLPEENGCPAPGPPLAVGGIAGLLHTSGEVIPQAKQEEAARLSLWSVAAVAVPLFSVLALASAVRLRRR